MTATTALAQDISVRRATWDEATAGSELERYLRLAQIGGDAPLGQFTARGFSSRELAMLAPTGAHPWAGRFGAAPTRGWWVIRPSAQLVANSGFAFGRNDGPMWAGRGLTGAAAGGVAFRWGALSGQLAPQAWWAQNASFRVLPVNSSQSETPYSDFAGGSIDLPQRMGPGSVGRIDGGESYLRLDAFGATAGVSTAADWWGPGVSGSPLLSNNAGGIPRAFVGTSSPRDVWVGDVSGRIIVGQVRPSGIFHDNSNPTGAQLATAAIGVFSPRGLPGLELGAIRFFHQFWPEGGPRWHDISVLWSAIAPNIRNSGAITGNEIASIFGRLVLPASGLEVYTEFARDDHNSSDNIDLITEPDHDALIVFGFQKRTGARGASAWWVVRGEVTDARMTHLNAVRDQVLFYQHGKFGAGHTLRGQLLGSPFVRGGSGAELAVDHYSTAGRESLSWTRQGLAVNEVGGLGYGAIHALEASALRFTPRGDVTLRAGLDWRVGSESTYNAMNLNLSVGWQPR